MWSFVDFDLPCQILTANVRCLVYSFSPTNTLVFKVLENEDRDAE